MLWVVEFQKCGLPHVHILVILSEDDQIKISSEVNDIICAELPTDMFQKNSEEYQTGSDCIKKHGTWSMWQCKSLITMI